MQRSKRKIVLATGAFDLLHYGHLKFLEEAKKAGGPGARLFVIVARDRTVKNRKGMAPILSEDQRRVLVETLKPVEKAILGFEDLNMGYVITKLKPDIIAVGYDQEDIYSAVKSLIEQRLYKIKLVRISKFSSDDLDSSSKIKRRVIEELNNQ